MHSYGRQHAIRMRLLNLESLQARGADLSADMLQHLDRTTSTVSQPVIRRRILKGRREDGSNVVDFSRISGVSLEIIYRELIRYSRHNLPAVHSLPVDHAMLRSLPVELLNNSKYQFFCSKKPMFTRSTVRDPPAPYTLETRAVAMIGFGYRRLRKKCTVRCGVVYRQS